MSDSKHKSEGSGAGDGQPSSYYEAPQPEQVDTLQERAYLPGIFKGIGIASKHFFRNFFLGRDPNVDVMARKGGNQITTVQYPEEKQIYPPGYRGMHRLVPREDGKPRCVACYMCATICPAQCIYIEAGEYPTTEAGADSASAVIEKYPVKFIIDELRCVVCGLCVEACPKDAIRMDTGTHAPPAYERPGFLWGIDRLLTGPAVAHPSDPWLKRHDSEQPAHGHKEAHMRIASAPAQVEITRFEKKD